MAPPAKTPRLIEHRLRFGMRPGLERIQRLLHELEDPHRAYPVIHVAGTNGKGSTSAMLASILAAAGYRVGLYTSPHLISYGERIVVDGAPLDQQELDTATAEVEPAVRRVEAWAGEREGLGNLTEFEVGTAIAFHCFRRAQVDVAVVEVGLGGRLDATNVVSPVLAVMTPVDLDHTQVLGETRAAVAGEKAGILKPGIPLVLAPQHSEALQVILRRARQVGVSVWRVDDVPGDFAPAWKALLNGEPAVPLVGPHQVMNGQVAVLAAAVLARDGWSIRVEDVVRGLEAVRWPGRVEVVQRQPLVVLDGAHNLASVRALASALATMTWPRPAALVFGTLAGKPAVEMLHMLAPYYDDLVLTEVHGRLPAQDPAVIARALGEVKRSAAASNGASSFGAEGWRGLLTDGSELERGRQGRVLMERDPHAAFERARAMAGERGAVLVSGSLYLVGALRGRWPFPKLFERVKKAPTAATPAGSRG